MGQAQQGREDRDLKAQLGQDPGLPRSTALETEPLGSATHCPCITRAMAQRPRGGRGSAGLLSFSTGPAPRRRTRAHTHTFTKPLHVTTATRSLSHTPSETQPHRHPPQPSHRTRTSDTSHGLTPQGAHTGPHTDADAVTPHHPGPPRSHTRGHTPCTRNRGRDSLRRSTSVPHGDSNAATHGHTVTHHTAAHSCRQPRGVPTVAMCAQSTPQAHALPHGGLLAEPPSAPQPPDFLSHAGPPAAPSSSAWWNLRSHPLLEPGHPSRPRDLPPFAGKGPRLTGGARPGDWGDQQWPSLCLAQPCPRGKNEDRSGGARVAGVGGERR